MIYLIAYKIIKSANGKETKFRVPKFRLQWVNEFNEFNIFEPIEWRKYLANTYRLENGSRLPDINEDGDRLCYEVYVAGLSKAMQDYFNVKSGPGGVGKMYLFPGYNSEGDRRLAEQNGFLREIRR